MCGRFTQAFTWGEVVAFYQLVDEIAPSLSASWNVAPTHDAGVIVLDCDGLRFQPMRWGLVPSWAKDPAIGNRMINARRQHPVLCCLRHPARMEDAAPDEEPPLHDAVGGTACGGLKQYGTTMKIYHRLRVFLANSTIS